MYCLKTKVILTTLLYISCNAYSVYISRATHSPPVISTLRMKRENPTPADIATKFCVQHLLYESPTYQDHPILEGQHNLWLFLIPEANCKEKISGELCKSKMEAVIKKSTRHIFIQYANNRFMQISAIGKNGSIVKSNCTYFGAFNSAG